MNGLNFLIFLSVYFLMIYMKGVDTSYRYEGYSIYRIEDMKKAISGRDIR